MLPLFDLKKINLSKTILWSIIIHLVAVLVFYLYPKPAPMLNLNIPVHPVKLVKLKKRRSRRIKRKKKVRKKRKIKKTVKPKTKPRQKVRKAQRPLPKKPAPPPPPEKKKSPLPPKEEEKPEKEVLFETSRFQFNYYLDIIRSKVLMGWNPDAGFLEPEMEVKLKASFRIQRNGEITDLILIKGSFDDLLNESALQAVLAARPMPPLPEVYNEDYLTVNFTFFLRGTYK